MVIIWLGMSMFVTNSSSHNQVLLTLGLYSRWYTNIIVGERNTSRHENAGLNLAKLFGF